METNKSSLDLVMILVLLALAVILIEDQLIRAGVSFVPALLLVQRAGAIAAGDGDAPKSERYQASKSRSTTEDVRGYIDELLKDIKELYTTTHLMAGGQLPPEEAKERAAGIEKSLNLLLAKVSEAAKV